MAAARSEGQPQDSPNQPLAEAVRIAASVINRKLTMILIFSLITLILGLGGYVFALYRIGTDLVNHMTQHYNTSVGAVTQSLDSSAQNFTAATNAVTSSFQTQSNSLISMNALLEQRLNRFEDRMDNFAENAASQFRSALASSEAVSLSVEVVTSNLEAALQAINQRFLAIEEEINTQNVQFNQRLDALRFDPVLISSMGYRPPVLTVDLETQPNITEYISINRDRGQFRKFYEIIDQSDITGELLDGTYTIFVPLDEGFSVFPPGPLFENEDDQDEFARNHVVSGTYFIPFAESASGSETIYTVREYEIKVLWHGINEASANNSKVLIPNVETANGVVHVIDRPFRP